MTSILQSSLICLIAIFLVKISGKRFAHDIDGEPSLDELVAASGHKLQRYELVLSDGYIVTVMRIKRDGAEKLKPVLFVHGVTACPDTMFIMGNGSAPIFLANHNFDVWLLGNRGTFESLKHVKLNSSINAEYWDFSFEQIGMIDIPSTIDLVLSNNENGKVSLIGHSAGSTAIFVTLSGRPEYNDKVAISFHLGSAIYHTGCSGFLGVLCSQRKSLQNIANGIGMFWASPNPYFRELLIGFCKLYFIREACRETVQFTFITTKLEYEFPFVVSKAMCGGSSSELVHFAQIGDTNKFARYDFGLEKNLEIYNTSSPPEFPLELVTSPVVIWCGSTDVFCSEENLNQAKLKLPNVVSGKMLQGFGHVDYLLGVDFLTVCLNKILKLLARYA